jgi:hypothetical protein
MKGIMTRALLVLIAAISVAAIWLDPFTYTLHPAGPERAPLWWRVFAVADTFALAAFAWSVLRSSWREAFLLIAASTNASLVANALYVWLRGVDRFLVVFRTEEILSPYLLVMAMRVVALLACGIAAMNGLRDRSQPG